MGSIGVGNMWKMYRKEDEERTKIKQRSYHKLRNRYDKLVEFRKIVMNQSASPIVLV